MCCMVFLLSLEYFFQALILYHFTKHKFIGQECYLNRMYLELYTEEFIVSMKNPFKASCDD
jgi:hypothetical protein